MSELPPYLIRSLLGLVLGFALGFVARRGRFCTLGAIEDAIYGKDTRRLRAWGLAAATAMIGVQALEAFGALDLSRSIYTAPRIEWGGAILGGVLFGLGMALVGTCGFGALLRLGGGDLRALLVFLVMAFTAMMTMRGVTGLARIPLTDPLAIEIGAPSQRLPDMVGLGGAAGAALAVALAAALAAGVSAEANFLRSRRAIVTGLAIGALVAAGWWATGVAGFDAFDTRRVESFSFVAPLGETVLYMMLASGLRPDFPVGAVIGVVAGACVAALWSGEFRWEAPDDAREAKRHVLGAFLMGSGGIAALGCTIGQGVTGISTLAIGSLLSIAAIFVGARIGLYMLIER